MKKLVFIIIMNILLFCGNVYATTTEYSIVLNENTGKIFDVNDAGFSVCQTGSGAQAVTVRCDLDGQTIINESITLGSVEQSFSITDAQYGKHQLYIEISVDGVIKESVNEEITIIKEHISQLYDSLSRVGVVQHRGQSAVTDIERVELMSKAGVFWARDLLSWWSYETEENVWNNNYGDKVCKVYDENGTKLHLTLCHYNDIYNDADEKGYAPYTAEHLEKFASYVEKVVTSYPNIKEFEIYNEPNRDNTWKPEANIVAYCNLVKVASRVIREIRPDARIIAGAVSNTNIVDGTSSSKGNGMRFLRQMAELGIFDYVDAISAHPYMYTNYSDGRYTDFLGLYSDISREAANDGNKVLLSENFEQIQLNMASEGWISNDKIGYYTKTTIDGTLTSQTEETQYAAIAKDAQSGKDTLKFNYASAVADIDTYTVKFRYKATKSDLSYTFSDGVDEDRGASFSISKTNGNIRYYQSESAPYKTAIKAQWDKWNDFALVINKKEGVWDLYVNNSLVEENISSRGNVEFGTLRFVLPSSASGGEICVDDVAIIEGDIFKDKEINGWYGWKEFQITETGFPVSDKYGIDENKAAENMVKSFVLGDNKSAERVFIYEFVSSGTNTDNIEHQYGILNNDRTARVAYPALVQYCNLVSGADYIGKMDVSGNAHLYQKDGEVIGVFWSEYDTTIIIEQDTEISCYDMLGNSVEVNGNILNLTETPIYIKGIDKSYAIKTAQEAATLYISKANLIADAKISAPILNETNILLSAEKCYYNAYAYAQSLSVSSRMVFADKLHSAAQAILSVYPLVSENDEQIVTDENIAVAKSIIEQSKKDGELPFADAILRRAMKYNMLADELSSFDGDSATKNATVYAKLFTSDKLAELAKRFIRFETVNYQDSIKFYVEPDIIKEYGKHILNGTIIHSGETALDISLSVCDNKNNMVGEKINMSLIPNEMRAFSIEYEVPESLPGGQYVFRLKAENDGGIISTQGIFVKLAALGPVDTTFQGEIKEFSDENYIFDVAGKKFLLLDDNVQNKCLIMALDDYSSGAFSTDGSQRFNPDNENSLAFLVNNIAFPTEIENFIDKQAIWRTEAGYTGGDAPNDYDVVSKASILSYTELYEYSHKIGWNDLSSPWWLRTTRGVNSWWDKGIVVNWDKGKLREENLDNYAKIRPVFLLDKDFFANVKLNNVGENIKNYLHPEQLMADGVYTALELEDIGVTSQAFESIVPQVNNSINYILKDSAQIYVAIYEDGKMISLQSYTEKMGNISLDHQEGQTVKIMVLKKNDITPICKYIVY